MRREGKGGVDRLGKEDEYGKEAVLRTGHTY
jgi:hypothetical protein